MSMATDVPPPPPQGVAAVLASLPTPDAERRDSGSAAAAAAAEPSASLVKSEEEEKEKEEDDENAATKKLDKKHEANLNNLIVALLCKDCSGSTVVCKQCTWSKICCSVLDVLRLRHGCADCGASIVCQACGGVGHFGCAEHSPCWGVKPLSSIDFADWPCLFGILQAWSYLRCRMCETYAPECKSRCRRVHWLCERCRSTHVCNPTRRSTRRVSRFLVALCQIENRCDKEIVSLNDRVLAQRAAVKAAAMIATGSRGTISDRARILQAKQHPQMKTRDMVSFCC